MNKNTCSFIVVILCFVLVFAATVTTYATGNDQNDVNSNSSLNSSENLNSDQSSEPNTDSSVDSDVNSEASDTSSDTDSDTSSDVSSDVDSNPDVNNGEGNGDGEGENEGEGEDEGDSNGDGDGDSDETTSDTVSKPNSGGISSAGSGGGPTFIDETGSGSDIISGNSSQNNDVTIGTDRPAEEEEFEYYEGEVSTFGRRIGRVIWIPILMAVLCIAGLVYINVVYKKKFAHTGRSSSGANSGSLRSSHTPVARRRRK